MTTFSRRLQRLEQETHRATAHWWGLRSLADLKLLGISPDALSILVMLHDFPSTQAFADGDDVAGDRLMALEQRVRAQWQHLVQRVSEEELSTIVQAGPDAMHAHVSRLLDAALRSENGECFVIRSGRHDERMHDFAIAEAIKRFMEDML